MAERLPDNLLSQLSEFVAAQTGLHFPTERWRDLERGIGSAAREFDFRDAESCIAWLVSSPLTKNQIETLASHLTVGETYFFREKRSFEILEEHILPELIRARRGTEQRLRIWSTGCCTGEEPYSIAMLLDKLIADIKDWRITILATDINPRFLRKASEGVYSEWSFRDTPRWIKEKYFTRKKDGRLAILPNLKKMVNFAYLNLAEDVYPALLNNTNAIDVIFCRNVLMYFAPEQMKKVIQNLYRSLVDGGWFIVSPSETSQVIYSQFITVNFPGVVLYRKVSSFEFRVSSSEFRVASSELRVASSGFQAPSADSELATLNLKPETSCPKPETSCPKPETLNPKPETLNPKPETLNPKPETLNSKPQVTPYAEALALYEQGRYAEAVEELVASSVEPMVGLVSHNQDPSKAIALLARACANQGKLSEALEWCEKAVAADKLNPGLHYLRATILQEQGAVDEAVISLKRALYLEQNFVLAHFALGNLMLGQGKSRESKKSFENALALLLAHRQEEALPESEGVTAGRLSEIIVSLLRRQALV